MILAATSGDTGKAALAGFANTPGLGITVFYPHNGTSEIQRLQMVTQAGDNVAVAAVEGNFDDTQSAVKRILETALRERLCGAEYGAQARTPLISAVWLRRSCITSMPMPNSFAQAKSHAAMPSSSAFPPETSAMCLLDILRSAWAFPLAKLYCREQLQ